MRPIILTTLVLAMAASPAVARDRTGYTAIAKGDFAGAEKTLIEERRIFPDRPELMLNLASVYRHTGRVTEAAAMYRAVIARPDIAMDLPNGMTASAHALAKAGLARSTAPELSAR